MQIVYNLETDLRYQQGKGIEEGIEKGIEKGEMIQKIKSIKGLISSKLLNNQQIAVIEEVSVEFVENIEKQLSEEN